MDPSYAGHYADLWHRHWWWRAREALVRSTLDKHLDCEAPHILDVGCGDGLFWPYLDTLGEVEGIEPDASLVAADSPFRQRIELCGFLDGRERPARYDLVLMLDVLEHIEDETAALSRVSEMLVSGGRYILTVPALMSLWSHHDVINGHYRRYRRPQLVHALEEAGFVVERCHYFFWWSVIPLLARRMLFRKDSPNDSAFVSIPPKLVNSALCGWSRIENRVAQSIGMPWGSSLLAVGTRP